MAEPVLPFEFGVPPAARRAAAMRPRAESGHPRGGAARLDARAQSGHPWRPPLLAYDLRLQYPGASCAAANWWTAPAVSPGLLAADPDVCQAARMTMLARGA